MDRKQADRKKETWRAVKFVLFSASAGIIEITLFTLLNELTDWPYWPCYLLALFYCVFTPLTTVLGSFLAEDLHRNEYLVTGLNMALNLVTEYLYDSFVVFLGSIDTNKRAQKT